MQHLSGTAIVAAASRSTGPNSLSTKPAVVPVTDPTRLPAKYVPEIDRGIPDRVVVFWEGVGEDLGPPVLRRELVPAEKSALEMRIADLRRAVAPFPQASRDALLDAIEGMLGAWPTMQRFDRAAARAIAAGYLWTARERPHWATVEACDRVRAGSAEVSREFCPSEAVFNDLVGKITAVYWQQLAKNEQLLQAKIAPPDPPKLSAEEIAAKLGRPPSEKLEQPPADGKHMERVFAELAARRAERESQAATP